MLRYDQQAPVKSWVQLLLRLFVVCSGTAGATYLFWRIHWIAAVVVAIPIWILLVDLLVSRRHSVLWYFLDFLRYILADAGTAATIWYLWKIDWRIGAIAILPVFILILNIVGFLTPSVYDITLEARASRKAMESFEEFDRDSGKSDSLDSNRPS